MSDRIQSWRPAVSPLLTIFASDVNPNNMTTPYPRPQLVRPETTWTSLNGLWEFNSTVSGLSTPSFNSSLGDQEILVPYPVESPLSGIRNSTAHGYMWYRKVLKTDTLPCNNAGLTLLHIEASDWNTTVYVNSHLVSTTAGDQHHLGGYAPFSYDITEYLMHDEYEILIGVYDPTEHGTTNGVGKQYSNRLQNPAGIFYTATSGIWGTVWLECVPPNFVEELNLDTSDPENNGVKVDAKIHFQDHLLSTDESSYMLKVYLLDGSSEVASGTATPSQMPINLKLEEKASFQRWNPDQPYLYGLRVELVSTETQKIIDTVKSYVGVRTITLEKTSPNAPPSLILNGKPIFQMAPLDQGFSPDGNYAYATDDAMVFDLMATKQLGFNTIRKHVKMEPRRWYYHTDRLGLLVWQDLPARDDGGSDDGWEFWMKEMLDAIHARQNYASIVQWTTFNEGWGQNGLKGSKITRKTVQAVQKADPTRVITDASGGRNVCSTTKRIAHFWSGGCYGNVTDMHHYSMPDRQLEFLQKVSKDSDKRKSLVFGEYGGVLLKSRGHEWYPSRSHGYAEVQTRRELELMFDEYADKLVEAIDEFGISGAVYTQITDVETECNGLLTYDRIFKVDPRNIAESNSKVINHFKKRHASAGDTSSIK